MEYLVSGKQAKMIDTFSIWEVGIPSLVLMERASLACANIIRETTESTKSILAVCGYGNNGGDGVATARILKEAGFDVSVLMVGKKEKVSEETKQQLTIANNLKLPIYEYGTNFALEDFEKYDLFIDALFGIGLSKPVTGVFAEVIEKINKQNAVVYAVDIPSGIEASSGKVLGCAVKASKTVTFGCCKIGLKLYPGAYYAGEVYVEDIGFPKTAIEKNEPYIITYTKEDLKRLPERKADSNKGSYGRVLVIGGAKNMAGAVCLAAKAAYRTGAGLVKVLTCEENRIIVQTQLPEALLSTYEKEEFTLEWLEKELEYASVVVLGPGLSMDETACRIVPYMIENCTKPIVLDADALNIVSRLGLWDCLKEKENLILTPHLKEMNRLCGISIQEMKEDLPKFLEELMKGRKHTLVLKDARTLVYKDEKMYLNQSGNNGMAVGGSGDVLSGIIGGLLAQKMEAFDAATLGVYLHGLSGDVAAEKKNEYSMTAMDICDSLAEVMKRKKDCSK